MTTTLITGAGGFIARHLAHAIRNEREGRVVGVDVRAATGGPFDAWIVADLTDPAAARTAVDEVRPDRIFHLAGLTHGSEEVLQRANVDTTANILEASRAAGETTRVVVMGSAAEYGHVAVADQPVRESHQGEAATPYGRAKQTVSRLAAAAAAAHGTRVCIARPFNVIGPGVPDTLVAGAIISRLRAAIAPGGTGVVTIGRTTAIRDFIAVEDVVAGLLRIAAAGRPGEAYNLCSGEGHAISALLKMLLDAAGTPVRVEGSEALQRAGDVDQMIGSRAKAQRELDWTPERSFASSVHASWQASAG